MARECSSSHHRHCRHRRRYNVGKIGNIHRHPPVRLRRSIEQQNKSHITVGTIQLRTNVLSPFNFDRAQLSSDEITCPLGREEEEEKEKKRQQLAKTITKRSNRRRRRRSILLRGRVCGFTRGHRSRFEAERIFIRLRSGFP